MCAAKEGDFFFVFTTSSRKISILVSQIIDTRGWAGWASLDSPEN